MVFFPRSETGDGSRLTGETGRSETNATTASRRHPRADGGLGWNDLTGFQRDLLKAIRRCDQEDTIPTGQTIKDHLEVQYGEEINNGRLYQNLGHLVESGLLEKGFVDGRTNTYSLNPAASGMLDETAHHLADICGLEVPARKG